MTALPYRNSQTYRSAFTYQGESSVPTTTPYLQLAGVLNQLAGTTDLGEDGAANVWAGTTANRRTLVGALNVKNGSYGLGLNLVCNQLASTSGLYATAALNSLAGNGPP